MNKQINKNLTGTWHIYEMEEWEEEYFNMEGQAFIELRENNTGNFQFEITNGYIIGKMVII